MTFTNYHLGEERVKAHHRHLFTKGIPALSYLSVSVLTRIALASFTLALFNLVQNLVPTLQ